MHERIALSDAVDGALWTHAWRANLHPRHSHDELEANFVLAGSASYLLPDRREPLTRGTWMWLFPGQEHMLAELSRDFRMWIVVVRQSVVRRLIAGGALPAALAERDPPGRWTRRLAEPAVRVLDALTAEVAAHAAVPAAFNAGLSWLLATAGAAFARGAEVPAQAAVHPAVRAALRRLAEPGATPSAHVLAAHCGLSPDSLARIFRREIGMRISEYANHLRVGRAQALIAASAGDLTAIALEAGFGSYTHFHRTCVRVTGRAPSRM